jgi:hypothetical protein
LRTNLLGEVTRDAATIVHHTKLWLLAPTNILCKRARGRSPCAVNVQGRITHGCLGIWDDALTAGHG